MKQKMKNIYVCTNCIIDAIILIKSGFVSEWNHITFVKSYEI